MKTSVILLLAILFAWPDGRVAATALTYSMAPHERACFYTQASREGEKIGFYFAVQAGGSFDIDYEVTGPAGNRILNGRKERQGDFIFSAKQPGEHAFCFSNTMSTFSQKTIDLDISSENEFTVLKATAEQHVKGLDDSVGNLNGALNGIQRMQKYFRTRENRHFDTVKSTQARIFWFGGGEVALVVLAGLLEVFVIEKLLNGNRTVNVVF
ncbi:uncharacterized protein SPPG_04148 [Spizellomyces punctatus DAOM BR117]|uniref:GOLD domain-containing protein n=1 Tax=Spizellomyces punctatus (strain DAOM BR117) TaxID=645134 RepID=A0A0L0HHX0_SPIPD|nr:uncharacterized protein SPPG_04148 [Spizellomyces punctatus DAOM BR117]KND01056.1 hypothetical protein SPPG_04148 [Spizellomyces punctatus DAOM BR117]|eukprot:XP_016609095.1 hypothetical protein SPPG_04148 [Spizellomyces punctatus DAOM BR117]